MNSTARYSAKASGALAYLKRSQNDIDVFVEDTSCANMWNTIIRKHLPSTVKFNTVNMLGGKEQVLKAYEGQSSAPGKPCIFIVDSDFEVLIRARRRVSRNSFGSILYCTLGYCIENHVLQEECVIDIAGMSDVMKSDNVIKSELAYRVFLESNDTSLRRLFCAFYVVRMLSKDMKTVGINCSEFYVQRDNLVEFDRRRVDRKIAEYYLKLTNLRVPGVRQLFREAIKASERIPIEFLVSGKDYLVPPVYLNVRRKFQYKGTVDQFIVSLARSEKYKLDRTLTREIRKLVS